VGRQLFVERAPDLTCADDSLFPYLGLNLPIGRLTGQIHQSNPQGLRRYKNVFIQRACARQQANGDLKCLNPSKIFENQIKK
jgi:hypothetical protein